MAQILGVIDIGSNTSTLAVYRASLDGGLDRILQEGAPQRLIRQIGPDGRFSAAAIKSTVEVIRRFQARAEELGATVVEAVATSAVRDAVNQDEFMSAVRAVGVSARVLTGEAEGACAVVSAVNTLPFTDGFVVDLGGGSIQIAAVTGRRAREVASLPLGALRLSDRFFTSDPPDADSVTALRRHIQHQLAPLRWFRRGPLGGLIGVGGAVRCLAKMDRKHRSWPIATAHGYELSIDGVESLWEQTSRLDASARADLPGLPSHRVDIVAASALVFFVLMRAGGFEHLTVSSYGVREGVAFRQLFGTEADDLVPDVRVAGLTSRFPGGGRPAATRMATALGLDPALAFALTCVLPQGRAAIDKLLDKPLPGFTHDEILALVDVLAGTTRVLSSRIRERLSLVAEVALLDTQAVVEGGKIRATVPAAIQSRLDGAFGP